MCVCVCVYRVMVESPGSNIRQIWPGTQPCHSSATQTWVKTELSQKGAFEGRHSESESRSVVSDPLQPHGLPPTKLCCPWGSPGKNTEVG